ncbi:GNAT family N-acetyltransferase [Hymenobacter puniceus]|uniref:GNAT family N-acetyltransferase n=1 Tax=Hymenobacter sp. BT190 TaxID=2763505 RepID=UPI001650FBEB|nr:GNAT family N-acetyltransferase [Hymenobacter sp. BT190]MBC6697178.1 GNAT family N-acetyltransferase [Hymenobacter sp. BT190]
MPLLTPQSPAEWVAYYRLRYEVLRQPWQQPEGSERVPEDSWPSTIHALYTDATGQAVGVAMLQAADPGVGQVRFMAVAPSCQGQGIGKQLLQHLEAAARQRGYHRLVLHARETAVPFYEQLGYTVQAPSHTLFGVVAHFLMAKDLYVSTSQAISAS